MESWQEFRDPATVGLSSHNAPNGTTPTDDQFFLLSFIMGTYFGPDLKGERPQKSALQRKAEGLSPYTSGQLAGSRMKAVQLERVYFYVIRKAEPSVMVNLHQLRQFFHGSLPTPSQESTSTYLQLPDLFPPQLHPYARSDSQCEVIENIVFLKNPETLYIKPENIQRFKRLTRLEEVLLNRDTARMYTDMDNEVLMDAPVLECHTHEESVESIQYVHEAIPLNAVPWNENNSVYPALVPGPAMIYLPSHLAMEEWNNIVTAARSGFALTGSAVKGQVGTAVGLIDIGECNDSYLFRVSLPGVKNNDRDFSCEVETNGKVLIKGVTATGEKRVHRHSEVFEMQSQNLCPPGHFSISFKLPGPINPKHFSGHFGSDGILEGTVGKKQ